MKKYLAFIITFILSMILGYILFCGIMIQLQDTEFSQNPPNIIFMFILFFALPSLIAYFVAFEWKKPKKLENLENKVLPGEVIPAENPQHSHWLFALIATLLIGGAMVGLFSLIPPIQEAPYSLDSIDENIEFPSPTVEPILNPEENASESAQIGDISTWKTYADNTNNFSIKYPDKWRQYTDNATINNSTILTPDPECSHCGGRTRGIYISVLKNENNLSSEEYVKQQVLMFEGQQQSGQILNKQPAYFSSLDATVVNGLPGAGTPGLVAYIKNNNQIIELFSDGIEDNMVNKIFSTFKFL